MVIASWRGLILFAIARSGAGVGSTREMEELLEVEEHGRTSVKVALVVTVVVVILLDLVRIEYQ